MKIHLGVLGLILSHLWDYVWVLGHYSNLFPLSCLSFDCEPKARIMTINMMKSKFDNYLITHLDLVVKMYVQQFYNFDTFHFYIIIHEWGKEKFYYGG